jgi:hypothetical protein
VARRGVSSAAEIKGGFRNKGKRRRVKKEGSSDAPAIDLADRYADGSAKGRLFVRSWERVLEMNEKPIAQEADRGGGVG